MAVSDMVFRDAASPSDPDANLTLRYENTVNTPIASASWLDNGRAVSDEYELIFTVSGSATCQVVCNPKNPAYTASVAVTADGSTVNENLIPGVGIVLSASTATGWKAKLSIGELMASDGSCTSRFAFGIVQSGNTTSNRRIAVVNPNSESVQGCKVTSLPGLRYSGTGADNLIKTIDNHSSDARDKMASGFGSATITFANWADGTGDDAGFKVADILVDGNTAVATARFDGATLYEWGVAAYDDTNDYLPGMGIMLENTTDDPRAASITLLVTEGYDWVELAPDSSGSPGTWVATDIDLTEAGETTGTITASGTAYFWVRTAVPSAATRGVMKTANVAVRGLGT